LREALLNIPEELIEPRVDVIKDGPELRVVWDLFVGERPNLPQKGLDRFEAGVHRGRADERLLRLDELPVIFGVKVEPEPTSFSIKGKHTICKAL
jgi:hypothetical protein